MSANHSVAEKICLTCGLCCNGVIFADVQLQPGDDAAKLESLGLPLKISRKRSAVSDQKNPTNAPQKIKFPQPCVAFDGCRCRIYADRPNYCRAFDCALLKNVNAGAIEPEAALQVIEKARRRTEKVRQLLRKLGDKNESAPLAARFRRMTKRIEQSEIDPQTARLFGELGLAFHNLNILLAEKFYPGV